MIVKLRDIDTDVVVAIEVDQQLQVGQLVEMPITLAETIDEPNIEKPTTGTFVLQHHWWKKREVIRAGPSEEHWDIRIDVKGQAKLLHLTCTNNPLAEQTDCGFSWCEDKKWMTKGTNVEEIKPGQPGNPTIDTPAYIEIIDKGSVTVFDWDSMFGKVQFKGKKLIGLYTVEREHIDINLWVLSPSKLPEAK